MTSSQPCLSPRPQRASAQERPQTNTWTRPRTPLRLHARVRSLLPGSPPFAPRAGGAGRGDSANSGGRGDGDRARGVGHALGSL